VSQPLSWRVGSHRFDLTRRSLVLGIVNVTPDSFSDGGHHADTDAAIRHGLALVAEGADLLDVGGESTRPGAVPVGDAEELRRVLPVIRGLAAQTPVPISIDTRHATVAEAALAAGATIINDVEAGRSDPRMWTLVRDAKAAYICMHMQGDPQTMQASPSYTDVTAEIIGFLKSRLAALTASGVDPEGVVLDPGFGFGKTVSHNLELLRRIGEFSGIGRPVLVGISRKGFIGRVTGGDPLQRVAGGLVGTIWAALAGARIFRTHDVGETVRALRMLDAIQNGPHQPG